MKNKIAIVDDHHLVRNGLVEMINKMDSYQVMLEASNGKELIEQLEEEHTPDIVIVDLQMPIMDGFETITWLSANKPGLPALTLTLDSSDDAMARSIRCGARGFVKKNARPSVLKTALDAIMLTGYYHNEEIHKAMMSNPLLQTSDERKREDILAQITPREMEFLEHVCNPEELTYEQISNIMGISQRTVDHYRKELFEKFNIKSKAGLVLFAVKWKLVGF